MNTRIFTIILQMNKNELNAYDLQHLTANLRGGELKLRFNQQSSPMEVIVQQLDSNKVRQQTVHIIKVPSPSSPPLRPNFLCKEILFKLLTFRCAITCKSEESSPRKSLPVLYTPSVGPSRLRILSPLIYKEGHWFELLHERRTEPDPLWWLPGRSTRCIKNSFQLPRRTLTPCYISNDRALVYVCNLDNKPKIKDPYSKFNVRSKNNAHMQWLLSVIICLCICFSIFNGVTSLKQVPFFTEKK